MKTHRKRATKKKEEKKTESSQHWDRNQKPTVELKQHTQLNTFNARERRNKRSTTFGFKQKRVRVKLYE